MFGTQFIVIETSDNTDAQAYGPFNNEAEAIEYKTDLEEQDENYKEAHNTQVIVQTIRRPYDDC